jgi:hypothetical protein
MSGRQRRRRAEMGHRTHEAAPLLESPSRWRQRWERAGGYDPDAFVDEVRA